METVTQILMKLCRLTEEKLRIQAEEAELNAQRDSNGSIKNDRKTDTAKKGNEVN